MSRTPQEWMETAIALAVENVKACRGGPFAAIIVRDGELVASGVNLVTSTKDPTAHAEVVAIREGCRKLDSFQLTDCELYTSCEPCPMCLGAIYWARPKLFYYAATRNDAGRVGFDDELIYRELHASPPTRTIPGHVLAVRSGLLPFEEWLRSAGKTCY